jgi:hypothetical protein
MIQNKELFPSPSTNQQQVDEIITSELSMLEKKKNGSNKIDLVSRHLVAIESCLKRFSSSSWSGEKVSFMINSLHMVRDNDAGINESLTFLTKIKCESLNDPNRFSQLDITTIMYGLHGMSSSSPEVCA